MSVIKHKRPSLKGRRIGLEENKCVMIRPSPVFSRGKLRDPMPGLTQARQQFLSLGFVGPRLEKKMPRSEV